MLQCCFQCLMLQCCFKSWNVPLDVAMLLSMLHCFVAMLPCSNFFLVALLQHCKQNCTIAKIQHCINANLQYCHTSYLVIPPPPPCHTLVNPQPVSPNKLTVSYVKLKILLWAKNILTNNFSESDNFSDPKFFLAHKFFWLKIAYNILLETQMLFSPNFFLTYSFFGPKICIDPKKLSDPKCLCHISAL